MTREEKAIIYFKDMRKRLCDDYLLGVPKDSVAYKATMAEKEFYDTAINALEQTELKSSYNSIKTELDAISRQAAIDAIEKTKAAMSTDGEIYVAKINAEMNIQQLPSVSTEKTGHWIPTYGNVKCSVCGSVKDSRKVGKATHYCDFCGAKMVEPQESEEV